MNKSFLNPEKIISELHINNGNKIADLGCGAGYFSIAAAKAAGVDGKVYAVDIQKPVLSALQSRIKLTGISNIETVWADLETPKSTNLVDNSVDVVLLANVLYQSKKHDEIITETARALKTGGQLLVIEWNPDKSSPGPIKENRLAPETIKHEVSAHQFELIKKIDAGNHHFALLFKKK